jgi:carboxylesterase type B
MMARFMSLAFVLVTLAAAAWGQELTVVVDVPDLGPIQGNKVLSARDARPYWIFHGIPYANPESYVGPGKRFGPSEVMSDPLTDNGTVFEANRLRVFCPQPALIDLPTEQTQDLGVILPALSKSRRTRMESFRASESLLNDTVPKAWGQEDCLTININTPKIPEESDPLLPVIFFIHGGGSNKLWGSAFTGLRLMEKDVVLVTINYRLGTLGALDFGIDEAPGCGAMYDAITALKWVQLYIQHFGGDPNRVTIAGHSAGSMMVTHLMLSPLAKGLFHNVWGFSASALNVWATGRHPTLRHHLDVAHYAKCYDRDTTPIEDADLKAIAACMAEKPIDDLVHALDLYEFQEVSIGWMGYEARVPAVQSSSLTIPRFISEEPDEILKNGRHNILPLVLGATRHDGSFVIDDFLIDYLIPTGLINDTDFIRNDMIPEMLKSFGIRDDSGGVYHSMVHAYLGDSANSDDFESKIPGFIDIATVFGFKGGQYKMLEYNAQFEPRSYFYSLDYKGRWTLYNVLGNFDIPGGISHGDDMIYIFYLGPLIGDDMKVSRRMVDYLVNFAYHSNPTPPEARNPHNEITWPAYDSMEHPFLIINRVDKVGTQCPDSWIGASQELMPSKE